MILVTLPMNSLQRQRMSDAADGYLIQYVDRGGLTAELLAEAEVIIGNIPLNQLKRCEKLKWIQLYNAGADDFAGSRDLRADTLLTNATGAYGSVIAEHMLGMLFMMQKHLADYYIHQQRKEWISEGGPVMLEGKTAVLVGTGDIGQTFAKKLKALGCYTIGIKRRKTEYLKYFDELYTDNQMEEILPRADILALSLPQTEDTISFLDKNRLQRMKASAMLINVGRGSAVDTESLVYALEHQWIAGAALDVTNPEPLPKDHPLWNCKNIIITPHIAGNYDVPETLEKIVEIAIDNLDRYMQGRTMRNVVDRNTGYCR